MPKKKTREPLMCRSKWQLRRGVTYFLLNLQSINDRSQLAQNLVGFLVEFELGGDQVCEVSEGFRGV